MATEDTSLDLSVCFICASGNDLPDGEECAVCGRIGDLPPGASGRRHNDPAISPPKPESALARAVRLARGTPTPDDVPGIIQRWTDAKVGEGRHAITTESDLALALREHAEVVGGDAARLMVRAAIRLEGSSKLEWAKGLIQCLVDTEPDDVVADGGVTCLMVWRQEAERFLSSIRSPKP